MSIRQRQPCPTLEARCRARSVLHGNARMQRSCVRAEVPVASWIFSLGRQACRMQDAREGGWDGFELALGVARAGRPHVRPKGQGTMRAGWPL